MCFNRIHSFGKRLSNSHSSWKYQRISADFGRIKWWFSMECLRIQAQMIHRRQLAIKRGISLISLIPLPIQLRKKTQKWTFCSSGAIAPTIGRVSLFTSTGAAVMYEMLTIALKTVICDNDNILEKKLCTKSNITSDYLNKMKNKLNSISHTLTRAAATFHRQFVTITSLKLWIWWIPWDVLALRCYCWIWLLLMWTANGPVFVGISVQISADTIMPAQFVI